MPHPAHTGLVEEGPEDELEPEDLEEEALEVVADIARDGGESASGAVVLKDW